MTRDERLRAISAIMRAKHEEMTDVFRTIIVDMYDTLDTLGTTVQAAKRTAAAAARTAKSAERAIAVNRRMLEIIDKAHNATTALYEHDQALADAIDPPDGEAS